MVRTVLSDILADPLRKLDFQKVYDDLRKAYPDAVCVDAHYSGAYIEKQEYSDVLENVRNVFPGSEVFLGLLDVDELPDDSRDTVCVMYPKAALPKVILNYNDMGWENHLELLWMDISSPAMYEELKSLPPNDEVLLRQDFRMGAAKRYDAEWKAAFLRVQHDPPVGKNVPAPEFYIASEIILSSLASPEKVKDVMGENRIMRSRTFQETDGDCHCAIGADDGARQEIERRMDGG